MPEVDFSRGVRGKHYRKYREGITVVVNSAPKAKSPAQKIKRANQNP
jgi:hypothetical protein